jgi:prepilin-type N-terminal cleavage/methylation domain-containing protein
LRNRENRRERADLIPAIEEALWECRKRASGGFTLVELLVVIGIIALLIAILMPALSKSRYKAQLVTCAARVQQFAQAMNAYAAENKRGALPIFDLPNTGQNLLDVSNEFYARLKDDYKLPHQMFFCPLAPDDLVATGWETYPSFKLIGYQLWVPRKIGGVTAPPQPGDPGFVCLDPEPFRGPERVGDRLARNPILSDVVLSEASITPAPDADASRDKSLQFHPYSRHQWQGGRIDSINVGYAHGHVERLHGSQLRPRYKGNYWNWR